MEDDLDEIILAQLNVLLDTAQIKLGEVDKNIADRMSKKRDYAKQAEKVRINMHKKEEEIKGYSRQLAQGFINEKMFLELSGDANRELSRLVEQLSETEKLAESKEHEKENIIKSIDVLNEIIQEKALTNTNINLLVDKIIIKETDEIGRYNRPKLDIEIVWNAPVYEYIGRL